MSGFWLALGWLLIASCFLWWIWTNAEPEIPAGVTITHDTHWGWSYRLDDGETDLYSSGYWTRAAAIRAANTELQRLHEKDTAQ